MADLFHPAAVGHSGTAGVVDEQRPFPAAARAAVLSFARRRTIGFLGGVAILVMFALAVGAPWFAPFDPLETSFLDQLRPPSTEHWLGTDSFGRDVFSRIIFASRTALLVGFVSAGVGCSVGAMLGLVGSYHGGKTDLLLERLHDILLSFPLIILAVAVVAALGTGVWNVILAITIPVVPRSARVIRSSGLTLRGMPYVDAARCLGAGDARIILRHMLPNVVAPYLVLLTAFLGQAILLESSLSFLGLGVAEPTPAWGLMLRGAGIQYLEQAPWLAVAPGVAISAAVFAFNLLGDSLRDALDPRLRV